MSETLNGLTIVDWQKIATAKDEALAAMVLPGNLRDELEGWGFRSQRLRAGRFAVSDDGSKLSYFDDYDDSEYVLAESDYDSTELGEGGPRPFLATVLDLMRWAMDARKP